MTDHKYTDEEVIKALYCCNAGICEECPLGKQVCFELPLEVVAADTINRQKRLLELSEKGLILGVNISENWEKAYKDAKTEAIKEFAEAAKAKCYETYDEVLPRLFADIIDQVVKERLEEK